MSCHLVNVGSMVATGENKKGKGGMMKRALGLGFMTAVVAGVSGALMLGWAYEGPRRFLRRVKLYKAIR